MMLGPYTAKELREVGAAMGDVVVTVGDTLQYSVKNIVFAYAEELERKEKGEDLNETKKGEEGLKW